MSETSGLDALRQRIATEEGIPEWVEELHGGNETQLRQSAFTIRDRLGLPPGSPTLESAVARQQRAQAERNRRMNH